VPTENLPAATSGFFTVLQETTEDSSLSDVKTVVEIFGTLVTAAAVIVGAIWAYYRFIKGRDYRPRLDVAMSGEWLTVDDKRVLLVRVHIKNIGASVVRLQQKGTGLRVDTLVNSNNEQGAVDWVAGPVYSIFEEHAWIEPNETVEDDVLLRLGVPHSEPVLLQARLVWERSRREGNIVVNARKVLPPDATIDGESGEQRPSPTVEGESIK